MATINERLREAAKAGSEVELRTLLRKPGCDALAQDGVGMTALMWAACKGHQACVGLLLPASDALAKDKHGMAALMWAACKGHQACVGLLLSKSDVLARDDDGFTASELAVDCGWGSLARFMDAYALAQVEKADLEALFGPRAPRGRAVPRI